MRASLIDEMGQDYLQTARAKGLRDEAVRRRHAVPNALLPTMTLIFAQPRIRGLRCHHHRVRLLDQRARLPDRRRAARSRLPAAAGLFLLFSAAVIVANLFADLLYGVLDPRVRT